MQEQIKLEFYQISYIKKIRFEISFKNEISIIKNDDFLDDYDKNINLNKLL